MNSAPEENGRDVFVFPFDLPNFSKRLTSHLEQLPEPYKYIAEAFSDNIQNVVLTLGIPYSYTEADILGFHWQRILTAERLRAQARMWRKGDSSDETTEKNAKEQFREFIASDLDTTVATQVKERLNASTGDASSLRAARELARQGVVLIWSAFEVLARDFFVTLLNSNPSFTERLTNHPSGRKRFTLEKIDWQTLASFNFDISKNLGTLLAQRSDLDDIQTIRDAYNALFPEAHECNRRLASKDLWNLFQSRNLIVHRRGIVDNQFVERTGCSLPIGLPMWTTPAELETFLVAVVDAGEELIDEISRCEKYGSENGAKA